MPTYNYKCENCEYEFEQFQPITARPIRKCPQCKKTGLKRLIGSGAGILFKGSGFYQTDYRSESYKKAEKSEQTTSTKTTPAKTEDKTKSEKKKPQAQKTT